MSEEVTVTATKGKDGKYYYFESRGSSSLDDPSPLDTKRISKEQFDKLARRKKKNFAQEYNEDKVLVKFKYIDDTLGQWEKQAQRAKERKKKFEKENKKGGCAGLFLLGMFAFAWIMVKLLYNL